MYMFFKLIFAILHLQALGQSGIAAADDREDEFEQEEDIEQLCKFSLPPFIPSLMCCFWY